MSDSFLQKQKEIKNLFIDCTSKEEIYQKIIEIGRANPPLKEAYKTEATIVPGCQSIMHLHSHLDNGKVFFAAESEALISSGLASLLTRAYSGEPPETILKCPPDFLEELGISASLSPSRSNGLYSIHLRMKQDALKFLMNPK